MDRVKAFLVFPVAALHFAIVPWGVGADELVADAKISGGFLKKGLDIPFAVGKTVCKLKTVVGLDTFHANAPAGIPLDQAFQKVGGGIGRLLRIGGQETKPGELVNGGILEQAQLRVSNAAAELLSHPPGSFLPDTSSAGKVLAYKPYSSSPVGTSPAYA